MDKLKKFLYRHSQTSIALWMVVGGYLIYLAWQIFKTGIGDGNAVILVAAMIVFVIVGLLLLAVGCYSLFGGYNKENIARSAPPEELSDGEKKEE